MPRKIERVSWGCDLCGQEYTAEASAKECENRGVAIPEFKGFELVVATLSDGKKVIAQILGYGPEDGVQNPHEVPDLYDISISERDYNPSGRRKNGRHPCTMRAWPYYPRTGIIRLHIVEVGANCPICDSPKIDQDMERHYSPYQNGSLGSMASAPICRCGECGLRFFNRTQQESVNRWAKIFVRSHIKA